jgi:hypothetical protein
MASTRLAGEEHERLRALLCAMHDSIRSTVIETRDTSAREDLSRVETVTASDTVYRIDAVSEAAILAWLRENWPADLSTVIVMEGLCEDEAVVFPENCAPDAARLRCIIDPIDGTRGLMYDKRSAWILTGVAPNLGPGTTLDDIEVAAMTELPVAKQRLADQISAVRGGGANGVVGERVCLDTGARSPLSMQPSRAVDLHHGFVGISKFFPTGKTLLSRFEELLYARLYGSQGDGAGAADELAIFDDQYICSGGQLYELIAGRDRMIADLRPLAHRAVGSGNAMACHPYDLCTALILNELGGCVEQPDGGALSAPLDTTTPVAWLGFANRVLADRIRPVLAEVLAEVFPAR